MAGDLIPVDLSQLSARRIIQSLLVNVVVNTVIAVILTVIGFGRGFVVNLVFSQCIGNSIYFANLAAVPVYRRMRRLPAQIAVIVAAVVAGALVGTLLGALANGMRPDVFFREHSSYFGQVVLIALLFGFVISYVFISVTVISEEKVRLLESEKNAVEAELRLLQSQMEPHFLFNTLSNILGLIDSDREKAKRMLGSFTSFVRKSLLASRERTVSIGTEMETVRNYLDVFQVRMGDRLRYDIELPEGVQACRVPPLLVQPLVENAVKHGLEPSVGGGRISIRVERDGDRMRITVSDTGVGIQETKSGGIGIENVRKRLRIAHGEQVRLTLEPNEPSGVKATIELPAQELP
jgi:signal transduction histidine kinase